MHQQYPYAAQPSYDMSGENYRKLRRHGIYVGCCLLGYFALQEVCVSLLSFFGYYDAYLSNPAFQYGVAALIFSFLCLGLPFYLYSRKKGNLSYFKVLPFHTPQPGKKIVCLVLAGWAMCLAANFVAGYLSSVFAFFGVEENTPESVASSCALDVIMNFLCAAVMAPLVEEFVFRGVVMQPLRRYGEHFAVITTALFFGLVHGSPSGIIFAFISGVAIGYAVAYSRSLWVGIIIHALNNASAVFFSELERFLPDTSDVLFLIFCIAVIAVGIVAAVIYGFSYGFRLPRDASGLKAGKKIRAFYICVPVIIALVYLLVLISSSIL